ncbi:MAG: gliding motility-associated C-terminal domain-containing protein [Bacteroidales bacterium]|nr:gliding motility-associated C-terminal domain-containing protein [Bacteroidales bacterium]
MGKRIFHIVFFLSVSLTGYAQDITEVSLSSTPVTCGGSADGSISIEVAGGSGNLNYSLFFEGSVVSTSGSKPGRSHVFSGYTKSTDYAIYVADADPNTENLFSFPVIEGPDPIDIINTTTNDISCAGAEDGAITVMATGEDDILIYDLTGTVNASNASGFFGSLPTGNYTVSVSHGTCPSTDDTTGLAIDEPPVLTITVDNIIPATCFAGNDGSIEITAGGGSPSGTGTGYFYSWTGPNGYTSTDEDITALEPGDYTVEVSDNEGCTQSSGTLTVGQGSEITLTAVSSTNVSCNGGNDGTATVTASGGLPGYTYLWAGQGSGTTTSEQNPLTLVADTYNLTVTDAQGCNSFFEAAITITEPDPINASVIAVTNISCFGETDGNADVTVSGGTEPYASFNWTTSGTYNSTQEDPSNMPEDTFSLEVTDNAGCVQNFPDIITITEPEEITATVDAATNVSCFGGADGTAQISAAQGTPGYTYIWTGINTGYNGTDEDPTDLVADTYDLRITDANACVKDFNNFVTIDQPTDITAVINITDVKCNGEETGEISVIPSGGSSPYTFDWTGPGTFNTTDQNLIGLKAGSYDLTITDNQGCTKDFNNNTVSENTPVSAAFVINDLTCYQSGDGAIQTTISGGVAPYTVSWTGANGYNNNSNEDISSLDASLYTLTVNDALGCEQAFPPQPVAEPDPLDASFTSSDVICFGNDDGTINLTVTGGTPAYIYSWSGPGGFSSPQENISGLAPGNYSLTLEDASGCTAAYPDEVTISEPEDIQVTNSKTDISCNGADDGTISIVTSGGTPAYTFDWSGPDGFSSEQQNISSLKPGMYNLTVTDNNSCIKVFNNLSEITEPTAITVTLTSQTDLLCYDAGDGSVEIDVAQGTSPYTFSWTNNLGTEVSTDEDPQNLPAGVYSVKVTDNNFCTVTYTDLVNLTRPPELIYSSVIVTDVSGCPGDSNGEIAVTASGGTGSVEYSLNSGSYQSSGTFISLTKGVYLVTARDDNNCIRDTALAISEPLPLSIVSETATQAGCHGTSTGMVSLTTQGGTNPVTYVLNPPVLPSQTSGTFSGLSPGDYIVEASGSAGCTTVTSSVLTVIDPPELLVDSVATGIIKCNGTNDGKIEIFLTGGTAPYEYSINNEVTYVASSSFTGLGPGTYDVYARDAFGCTVFIDTYTLNEPPPINITVSTTDVTPCFGDASGAISAAASGGRTPFEYSITGLNYTASGDFDNLTAGDYTLFVRDSGGCSTTRTITITEPPPVEADVVKTNYVDDQLGTITISNISGGTPPFEYSITGTGGTFTTATSYTDLTAGTYEVVVRDANVCTYEETVEIFDIIPLMMIINTTDVTCFGDSDGSIEFLPQDGVGTVRYSIDNGSAYSTNPLFENLPGDSTYHLKAFDDDDKQYTGTIFINEPERMLVYKDITPAHCNYFSETGSADITVTGGTGEKSFVWSNGYTGKDLRDAGTGIYNLLITDESGCSTEETLSIPAEVYVNAEAGEDTTICEGSTITLNAMPGDLMSWEPAIYLDQPDIANPAFTNATDSTTFIYTITETASGYSCYHKDTLNIHVLPLYGIEVTEDTAGLAEQEIQLETTTTGNFDTFEWIPPTGLDNNTIPNPVVTLQNSTVYYLIATNDYGCIETDSLYIEVIEDITVYNAFSPNGDEKNDFFDIDNASRFPNIIVEVYNRWGNRLFSSVGYTDDKRWDGTFNGKDVPTGTYYYIIIPYSNATPITGNVTIIR